MAWVAAVLSLSGMFAVAAHVLARRRKEVAVRMAVGASGRSILRVCLRDVAWAMPIGIAAGLGAGVLLGRALEHRLYSVAAVDPAMLVAATLLMAGILVCGAVLPVRRALRTNLLDALRSD
jgi:ABC-type antimicrobial peptide transport system permease subunit